MTEDAPDMTGRAGEEIFKSRALERGSVRRITAPTSANPS